MFVQRFSVLTKGKAMESTEDDAVPALASAPSGDSNGDDTFRRPARRSTSLFGAEVYPRMENYIREEEADKATGKKSKSGCCH